MRVYAADLWMSPDHNWRRAVEASVADLVCPIKAEAHALPFAQGFFDAVVSVDAIGRDTCSLGCVFCHSIIVRVTTDTRQVAFCSCQLIEYRLLPKPTSRKANSAKP